VRTKSKDREFAGNEHFGYDPFVLGPLKVCAGMYSVPASPTRWSKEGIETIGVGPLVSIRDHLAANRLLILSCVGHPPFDLRGIKRHFQSRYQFRNPFR
jgi:hypothetical protein